MAAVTAPRRLQLEGGRPWPLGATVDAAGVNFAVFSAHASRIELCLFDEHGEQELARLPLPARSGDVWHGHLRGAGAGLVYGLRANGHWRPEHGHRFNSHKLLLDPWAREIVAPPGGFDWHRPHLGADARHPTSRDERDNARWAHKARVAGDGDVQAWQRPAHALADLVLYEVHVRAFTRALPGVPEAERGTYAGLASDAALAHLQRLGVTAVSLLPVQHKLDEARLAAMGLVNHWGYNTLAYFAPEPRYAATPRPREEFRAMVRRLHAAGIEVVIDVVFNHTAEGDEHGPTLSWRGLDNASWYRLPPNHRAGYENWSGCGNTLAMQHPRVLQFVMDSLRYWVQQMGVDGFRFDLAPVLGREAGAFDRGAAFFKAVAQDPVLQGVKMIAEPWDLGPGGYQLGHFPDGWLEWNDRFRDTARAFWLGGDCTRGEFARRLAGSADLYQARQRPPLESVNYVVSHDGFSLADLVSYDLRHNEANGEGNRDGHPHNLSWNCGFEGPTTDPEVLERRARLQRALLAVTLLAQGTPMLAAGCEMGHTQQGNNNPYCQDNALTWLDWSRADDELVDYVAHLVALRKRFLPLGPRWYTGLVDARGRHDLTWIRRTGEAMTPEHWNNRTSRILGAHIGAPGRGSAALLLLLNGRDMDIEFVLPAGRWVAELDSTDARGRVAWQGLGDAAHEHEHERHAATPYPLRARSVVLLREAPADETDEAVGGPRP
ncbi:MAG: glycogen debranching protein GlgX [Burkholderiales bacterium]|nr:glycogen debranching protein GlgX [Burkholderiales bacterium]